MKMMLLIPLYLLLLLSTNMFAQSLTGGAVIFSLPVIDAYQFSLMSGGYQDQGQANGFHYGNGTFHLWKNGGPGYCLTGTNPNVPGCRFDGTMGTMTATPLNQFCTQISFPIKNGELRILKGNGVDDRKGLTALYSQTFCSINGSMFMAGGTLVVNLN
jgi:hypothetical protein